MDGSFVAAAEEAVTRARDAIVDMTYGAWSSLPPPGLASAARMGGSLLHTSQAPLAHETTA